MALVAVLLALAAWSPPAVQSLRESLFDGYQRLFPRERKSAPALIVEIDERSLAGMGQWPWPRTHVAALVSRLAAHAPAAIAFDVLFAEPDRFSPAAVAELIPELPVELSGALRELPSNDQWLAQALNARPTVLAIAGLEEVDGRFSRLPGAAPVRVLAGRAPALREFAGYLGNVPELEEAAAGRGLISSGAARVVRRVPMLARVNGGFVPALSVELWRVGSGAPGFTLAPAPAGLFELSFAQARIPLQQDGTAWVRYAPHDPARFVSAIDVLTGRVDPERLRNRLVLVGVTGLGLLDYKVTALGEQVPGVEIHAQLIEQVFDGAYLVRPAWALGVELAGLALGAGLLLVLVPAARVRASVAAFAALLAALAAVGIGGFLAGGWLIDAAVPALGLTAVFAVLLAAALSEADRQRRTLREAAARAAGELEAARRIQMGLLPDPAPLFAGDRAFAVSALVEPARTVGGDFYDCFRLNEGQVFVLIADVSDKGMPAALFMALCKATIKAAALGTGGDPGRALERAAAEIARDNPEEFFVTVFAARLDLASGELAYCNAGHEPPFVRRPQGAPERLALAGRPPIGVPDRFPFVTATRQLLPGEWLCAITDGVTEAMNERGELYGLPRLEGVLQGLPKDATPAQITAAVRDDVRRFVGSASASDDLTLLALRWSSAR